MLFLRRLRKDFKRYWGAYLLVLPIVLYYIVFYYIPMGGITLAFKRYSPAAGIWGSEWVGLEYFKQFFGSIYFGRVLKNTIVINIVTLMLGFPAPIVLALLLNEVKNQKFKKVVQTISYLPHFISLVILCGMIKLFVSDKGIVTQLLVHLFNFPELSLLSRKEYFVPVYAISNVWQGVGWGSIRYLAALSGINHELYDAASIDGAGRWKQTLHVTLPGIAPTIITMLILRVGSMMSLGHEKIILLYNESIYETADVISSYVYRKGLLEAQWSFSTAVGLFNSVINFVLVMITNKISKKVADVGLW